MAPLVVSIISILYVANSQSDICFWGSDQSESSTKVNGLYRYAGNDGNDYYYRLDRSNSNCDIYTGGDYLYLQKGPTDLAGYKNQWIIVGDPDSQADFTGYCPAQGDSPLDCTDGTWRVITTSPISLSETLSGDCPQKVCESITVSADTNSGPCDGNTWTQTGRNMFEYTSSTYGTFVWWFNPLQFQWICTLLDGDYTEPETTYGYCAPGNSVGNNGGRELDSVNGFEGPFDDYQDEVSGFFDNSGGKSIKFECNAGGDTFTKEPTQNTPRPTLANTPRPTTPTAQNSPSTPPDNPSPTSPSSPTAPTTSDGGGDGGGDGSGDDSGVSKISTTFIKLFTIFALCLSVLIV